MNPATNATITAPTIRYVLLEPPDPLLRLLLLLFAKIFLFLVRGEIVAHAARLSEASERPRREPYGQRRERDPHGHHYGSHLADRPVLYSTRFFPALGKNLGWNHLYRERDP